MSITKRSTTAEGKAVPGSLSMAGGEQEPPVGGSRLLSRHCGQAEGFILQDAIGKVLAGPWSSWL